jgi:riboflavin synthase
MFTGIVEEIGKVKFVDKSGKSHRICIEVKKVSDGIQLGESLSVNGVCLTVADLNKDQLILEVMPQTLRCSSLGLVKKGDLVNLERALRVDGRVDGHFVSGHIDDVGRVSKRQVKGADVSLLIEASGDILRYVALKGSVALDGVSLTVSKTYSNSFQVNLIPFTLANTTLAHKRAGDLLNIECDILAKYIERLLAHSKSQATSQISASFLREHGFV